MGCNEVRSEAAIIATTNIIKRCMSYESQPSDEYVPDRRKHTR